MTARPSTTRSLARLVLSALALLAVLALAVWLWARPATPDAFYDAPATVPPQPGQLLRAEPFARALPEGARAWRILYTTTRQDGSPAIASALLYAPATPTGAHPLIAWAHGTSGVARGCAPSLLPDPLANVPAVPQALAAGWAIVAPDYPGLGTSAPPQGHAYLIGKDAARAVLDSVRAARQFTTLQLNPQTIVWGHSQGGNSALWTGMEAPTYAPDVPLAGVAAQAPATDLPALATQSAGNPFGRLVTAFLAAAYPATYPELRATPLLKPGTGWLAQDIASRCAGGLETLVSVAQTLLLPASGIARPEALAGPFGQRLAENVPAAPIPVPVFVAQGETDDLVLPTIQQRWVAARCAAGQPLLYRTYSGRDHIGLVAPDSPLTPDLVGWTADRLVGTSAPGNCPP
jgi:pimeloyl-ACP methyl ester carboxylesterase